MSTERERLIKWAKQLADPNWCLSVPKEAKDTITALLKEMEPRTVTTVEELDALPVGSAVRSAMGSFYVKDQDMGNPSDTWWSAAGSAAEFLTSRVSLPATLLHEGSRA